MRFDMTLRAFLLLPLLALVMTSAAQAQSLEDALIEGYLSNPTLEAERQRLRATDETVSQALSGWRPHLSLGGSYGYSETEVTPETGPVQETTLRPAQAQLQLRQNLFRGGQTQNAIATAEQRILSARARLDSTEQQIFLEIITAYFDVMTSRKVVALGVNRVKLLERQAQAAQDRFEVGEITRTDVAQARARLARAVSTLSQSERDEVAAEAEYARLIGDTPGILQESPPLPKLPTNEEDALALALEHAPSLQMVEFIERASFHAVAGAKGAFLPVVDVSGQYQYGRSTTISGQEQEGVLVMAQMSIPLYQSGAASSQVRQAASNHAAARLDVLAGERLLRARLRSAWERLRSVRARIAADERQVSANETAFAGLEREAEAGLRTTLDVLDAEQELFDSRVSLARSKRDEYVAAYGLLEVMGRMGAEDLGLPVDFYQPEAHYRLTRGRLFGYDGENVE